MSKTLNKKFGWLLSLSLLVSAQAFAFGGYSAIVFDPNSAAWGSSHGASSRQEAESNALAYCGAGCYGVDVYTLEARQSNLGETWAFNGWVAYARGDYGHFGTSGDHTSQYASEQQALARCGGYANNCYVVRSVASFLNYPDQQGTNINEGTAHY